MNDKAITMQIYQKATASATSPGDGQSRRRLVTSVLGGAEGAAPPKTGVLCEAGRGVRVQAQSACFHHLTHYRELLCTFLVQICRDCQYTGHRSAATLALGGFWPLSRVQDPKPCIAPPGACAFLCLRVRCGGNLLILSSRTAVACVFDTHMFPNVSYPCWLNGCTHTHKHLHTHTHVELWGRRGTRAQTAVASPVYEEPNEKKKKTGCVSVHPMRNKTTTLSKSLNGLLPSKAMHQRCVL